MFTRKAAVLIPVFLILALGLVRPCGAAAPPSAGDSPVKIAILPFAMHTPQNLNYLQSGVREMLTSRLAWQGKVQVIDKAQTEQAAKGAKEISQTEAVRIGNALKADYVLYGSITGMGQSISIDAKMAPLSGSGEPVSFFAQTKSLDDVIPQVNNFAQEINGKVFGKPSEKTQTASAEAEDLATKNPEFLLPGALQSGDKISYLNPNFIEVTADGTTRQSGIWRSQTFNGAIVGMDVGDLDGDGKAEIVTIQPRKLTIYRKEYQGLKVVATFEMTVVDRFVWVAVADPMKDGKSYIYLTNMHYRGTSRQLGDTMKDIPNTGEEVSSLVLTLVGNKVQIVADKIPYFLNTIQLGQRKVLVGQQQGAKDDKAFKGDMYEMQLRGGSLAPAAAISAPSGCNVFNFVKADLKNDHTDQVVILDDSHNMRIATAAGDSMWKGNGIFGATTNTFEARVQDRRYNLVDLFAIPSPMLVTDLNKDGIMELVVNRNTTVGDKFLPDSMKYYDRGEIVSLSWDQLGMVENWKTRELSGQVTALRIGDLDGSGKNQLVVSMVHEKDLLKFSDAKSSIITFDLNVNKAPAKPADAAKAPATPASDNEPAPKKKK